ncbi:MAG: DUF5924 family protein [Marinobacter sp.]|nr:DUF5924 family protein [Marinobacter sp.]
MHQVGSIVNRVRPVLLEITGFLRRHAWLVGLFGFSSGLASFLLVQRTAYVAAILAGLMLASWIWLILENSVRRGVVRWLGLDVPPPLLTLATQLIHQESLFFVLPFYLLTTTWTDPQALFTVLIIFAAITSILDPLYHGQLGRRRWLLMAFHTLTLFSLLLTALPLILHVSTTQSFYWSLGTATLLSFPSLSRALKFEGRWRSVALVALGLAIASAAWLARPWIPPATLWLTHAAVTQTFDEVNREPGRPLASIATTDLRAGRLYAFTAIRAPRGLHEPVVHVWLHNGHEVDRIPLDVTGGRRSGYRAWTYKSVFPETATGHWQVKVITEDGQMIGQISFDVTASGPTRYKTEDSAWQQVLKGLHPAYSRPRGP